MTLFKRKYKLLEGHKFEKQKEMRAERFFDFETRTTTAGRLQTRSLQNQLNASLSDCEMILKITGYSNIVGHAA